MHSFATTVAYNALNFTFYFTHPPAKIKEGRLPMRLQKRRSFSSIERPSVLAGLHR